MIISQQSLTFRVWIISDAKWLAISFEKNPEVIVSFYQRAVTRYKIRKIVINFFRVRSKKKIIAPVVSNGAHH
jgi:hypothetical protein